jgi:hypothetical protein
MGEVVDVICTFAAIVVCYFGGLAVFCRDEEEIGYSIRAAGALMGGLFAIYFTISLIGYFILLLARPDLLPKF